MVVLFTLAAGGDPLHLSQLLEDALFPPPGAPAGLLRLITVPLGLLSLFGAPLVLAAALWPRPSRPFAALVTALAIGSLPMLLFLGPGALHGALYLLALWASVTGLLALKRGGGATGLALGGAICLWSLVSLAAALIQIPGLVQGQPYCLARGGAGPATLADLRGLAFFTSETGYKSTSHWYFNGILLTPEAQWNWFARRLSFQPIAHPRRFTSSPRAECTPETAWLSHHLF